MRQWLILGALLVAAPVFAQTPQQHGLFDTNSADNPLAPQGTPASPFYTAPAPGSTAPAPSATPTTVTNPDGSVIDGGANSTSVLIASQNANRIATAEPDSFFFGGSASSAAVVGSVLDTTGYGSIVVQITSIGTGNTVVYEQSNDNTNWYYAAGLNAQQNGNALQASGILDTTTMLRFFAVQARYFRARVSVYGSGTVNTVAYARKAPIPQYDPQTAARSVAPANNPVGAAAYAVTSVTVATTATPLVAARSGAVGTGRVSVTLQNTGTSTVFLGNTGLTATNGWPLLPGAVITLNTTAIVYGLVASGTGSTSALETY